MMLQSMKQVDNQSVKQVDNQPVTNGCFHGCRSAKQLTFGLATPLGTALLPGEPS